MILKARYGGLDKAGESTDFNPYFGTDVGICSIVKPQLSFNQSLDHLPFWSKLFGPKESLKFTPSNINIHTISASKFSKNNKIDSIPAEYVIDKINKLLE